MYVSNLPVTYQLSSELTCNHDCKMTTGNSEEHNHPLSRDNRPYVFTKESQRPTKNVPFLISAPLADTAVSVWDDGTFSRRAKSRWNLFPDQCLLQMFHVGDLMNYCKNKTIFFQIRSCWTWSKLQNKGLTVPTKAIRSLWHHLINWKYMQHSHLAGDTFHH